MPNADFKVPSWEALQVEKKAQQGELSQKQSPEVAHRL